MFYLFLKNLICIPAGGLSIVSEASNGKAERLGVICKAAVIAADEQEPCGGCIILRAAPIVTENTPQIQRTIVEMKEAGGMHFQPRIPGTVIVEPGSD